MQNDKVLLYCGHKPSQMRSKKKSRNLLQFLAPMLKEQLNPKQSLYQLSHRIDWSYFEQEFGPLYSNEGRPDHPIRLMSSLLILRAMYNLSDEKLVEEHWEMNAYFQYFSGQEVQQWGQPCAASDLVHFRQRIGEQGVEKILKESIRIHGKNGQDPDVSVDTAAQEKNITYPTDTKLHKKIIHKCVKKASDEGIKMLKLAKKTLQKFMMSFLDETNFQLSSIDAIFPHQASKKGLDLFHKMFELGDRNVKVNSEKYSNCTAASIPFLSHSCIENGKVSRGDLCMLFGTSAVFTIGALVFNY